MLFKQGTQLYAFEIRREAGEDIMYINYLGAPYVPSLADSREVMARTIDSLIQSQNISRVVFVQQRNYNYDFEQVRLLMEIAQLYTFLIRQERILSSDKLALTCQQCLPQRYEDMIYFSNLLKQDPVEAYRQIRKMLISARARLDKAADNCKACEISYIRLLEKIIVLMESARLIKQALPYLGDYKGRDIYGLFFRPDIVPNFTFTRLVAELDEDAEIIEQYEIGASYEKSLVTILRKEDDAKYTYHLMPPEYSLEEEYQMLLNLARNVMIEHRPKAEEFTDVERTRQVFFNVARDLIQDLAKNKKIKLSYEYLNMLASILVRHTIGFGLVEVLLQDKNLQDIVLNAPIALNRVFVRHSKYDECVTNIIPSQEDADSWAAKFRMLSGRPLDEANPILDTDLLVGKNRARVAVIQEPLSPYGLAYALRRHRDEPWTLPLFIKNKMINSFSAGLMSFLIDGARTMLIAGTRSSGKCVDGDTMIQLANGDIQPIKKLEHGKKEKISDGFISYPNPEINVLSLNDGFGVNKQTVNAFWRREAPKTLIKITTKSGKEIITTKEHPYFIFKEELKSVHAENLEEDMLIATPRKIRVDSGEIYIPEANELISQLRTNAKKIIFPEKVNIELAEFLGYLIGDGHIDECKIEFTNSDVELRKRFSYLSQKLFSVSTKEIKSRNTYNIQINSRILNRTLSKIFGVPLGNKASSVKIPSQILKSNNEILAAFLRVYFDCDGYIPKNKRDIELATASGIMARQLQMALLRFGVISFVKTRKIRGRYYYRILVRGEFVNEYIKKIGFNKSDKRKRCENILAISWIENTNIDTIPDGNFFLKRLRKGLRVTPREVRKSTGKDYWAYENDSYNATRKWFIILTKFYNDRYNYLFSLKGELSKLEENSELDLFVKFRDILDIKSEELSGEICIGTISNFFNKIYKPKINTRKIIANKIKEIFYKAISDDVKYLLDKSTKLANSDIFWDRIKNVEEVVPKEEWVYDFSVAPTQNFMANGIFAHNTSLLGALMLEIMPKFRVIVVEDTMELNVDAMRKIGYDILRMKVRSAMLKTTAELGADEGIRTSLRFGDSSLIVGEVRSLEAKSLWEAMRVGALANVVMGTIHGASPYAVFDRVVNDLQVPATSFKATDAIIVCNPIKSADGLHSWKRVVQLAEVRKHWQKDPLEEKGFVDLLKYNVDKDELVASDELINGDSEIIKAVASNVKGWVGDWDAVYDNILLRAKIKEELVRAAEKTKLPLLLEAKFNSLSNAAFYFISDKVREEIGVPSGDRVFPLWKKWLEKEIKQVKVGGSLVNL